MTDHDFTIYNDILDIKQELGNHSNEFNISENSENRFNNILPRNNQNFAFNLPIPPFLKKIGVQRIRLENRLLLVYYNGHNLEIRIDQGNSHKGIHNLNFEFKGLSITDKTIDCIESFISDNWNLILSIIDSNKVINLLVGGITELFDTKIKVKEHEV